MYTVLNVNLLYCIHSVQVTSDSSIPDNTYTGQICYVKKGINRWCMVFMAIQNIKVFLEVFIIHTLLILIIIMIILHFSI